MWLYSAQEKTDGEIEGIRYVAFGKIIILINIAFTLRITKHLLQIMLYGIKNKFKVSQISNWLEYFSSLFRNN